MHTLALQLFAFFFPNKALFFILISFCILAVGRVGVVPDLQEEFKLTEAHVELVKQRTQQQWFVVFIFFSPGRRARVVAGD